MPNFRMGRLTCCPDFLATVPRPALVAAIRLHAAAPDTAGTIVTTHSHDGLAFHLETNAERTSTAIKLA